MSLFFNPRVTPLSGYRVQSRRDIFSVNRFPMFSNMSSVAVKCNFTTADLITKIKERMNGKIEISPSARMATVPITEYSDGKPRSPANGSSVDVCARLCLVDHFQDLGIDRFFQSEIQNVLHEAFRLWEKKDEEIFGDVTCRAMAFGLLRLEGYHVSSDELGEYVDEENFFNTVSLESSGAETVLELYKASQVRLPEDDNGSLEKLHDWTFNFLKQHLKSKTFPDKNLERKVEFNLKNYHGILDAVKHRRSIDLLFDVHHTPIIFKSSAYSVPAVYNEDLFLLSAQDFMTRQAQNLNELTLLLRWYEECRFDKMGFGRDVLRVPHFISANNIPDPQLSEARLILAKTMNLSARLDDFFDHHGSREDCLLLIELTKQWNEPSTIEFPSEEVEMLYSALHSTVTDIAEKAYPMQGRCIKPLLIHLWVELFTSYMMEMETCTAEIPPGMHEYLGFAWISVACRINILVSIHFLGEKLSEEIVMGAECTQLCKHASLVTRLLNDIKGFQGAREDRKVNCMTIQLNAYEKMSEEEAASNLEKKVEYHRKELLKMVIKREGSMVPKKCKDVFWKSCNLSYYLYTFADEFTSPQQIKEDMKLLFRDPLHYN